MAGRAIVPFQRPTFPDAAAVERYFAASRAARWYSNRGPCYELLANRLGAATGTTCVPLASGTLGLVVAIAALRGRADGGDTRHEALLPSFAFPAPAQAAAWNGLQQVFVDVDETHWHLAPDALERALDERGERVAVVVALSTFGTPPPPPVRERWQSACAAAGVPLLVDSAAGFGAAAADGRRIGAQGDAEATSFHATKPMAAGEAGAVFTNDPALAREIERLADFAFDESKDVTGTAGINAKLSEAVAAIALAALDRLPDALAARRERAERLLRAIGEGMRTQDGHERGTWQFVPVLAPDGATRDAIVATAEGRVELRTYYRPLHRMPAFSAAPVSGGLERTEAIAARIVSLPMAEDLSDDEIDAVAEIVRAGLEGPVTSAR